MKTVWENGYTIVRDGKEITLTRDEIREINRLIEVANGMGSIQYYIDDLDGEPNEVTERKAIAEEMLEDEDVCREIWNDYWEDIAYDTGYAEWSAVDAYVTNKMNENEGE